MSSVEAVDAPVLQVPFESLKRAAKDRKALVDEAAECIAALPQRKGHSKQEQLEHLTQLLSRLQGIKRKLGEVAKLEADDAHRCKARLEHLQSTGAPAKEAVVPWTKLRLDRILVDYMLRSGYQGTAEQLASDAGMKDLVDLHIFNGARKVIDSLKNRDCAVALAWCEEHKGRLKKLKSNFEFQLRVQEFIELVRAGRRMEAVAYARAHLAPWAHTYMDELQRAVATLVFTPQALCVPVPAAPAARSAAPAAAAASEAPAPAEGAGDGSPMQQDTPPAPAPASSDEPMPTASASSSGGEVSAAAAMESPGMQQAEPSPSPSVGPGVPAGSTAASCPSAAGGGGEGDGGKGAVRPAPLQYRALFDASRWAALLELFYRDLFRLHALPPEPLLVVHLQAGLAALKTPKCYEEGCSREDPLHLPSFRKLATGLPYSKHVRSKLVCSVTKAPMTDNNPPMALPNGYVYSARGIERLMAKNDGKVVCPHTGEVYTYDELRRAYVV